MNTPTPALPSSFARPHRVDPNAENRGSGVRASILESALELGLGTNRTVANWMFNPVEEEEDEELENEDANSPSLTYASTATSEESALSAGATQRSLPGAGILVHGGKEHAALALDASLQQQQQHHHQQQERHPPNGLSPGSAAPSSLHPQRSLQFDLRATPEPRVASPVPSPQPKSKLSKLRRKIKPDGGYESDGGYMSEAGKGKEKEKAEKAKKAKKGAKSKKNGGDATDNESDGGYLSEFSLRKKKSRKEKEKEKKEKDKSKPTDSPTTDNETDKGPSKGRPRKQGVASPVSGDESDGGYLSEASSKTRRFFRLNSRSRRKDLGDSPSEQAPPVPALPSLPHLNHPIADMWSRAGTPVPPDARNATPLPGDAASSVRPSGETFMSMDSFNTTTTDTSATSDTSNTVESDERRESVMSSEESLTRAFRDAESVRSPSIDFLSTFRRAGAAPLSPSKYGLRPEGGPSLPASPRSPLSPALSPSKSVRSRPKISAPNTTTLTQKHVPVPLTLTPPTPTASSTLYPPSPDPDYVIVTPSPSAPNTPRAPENGHSANLSVASNATSNSNGSSSPGLQRPKVLAYYDLPPPSPPPRGPLPDVPSDISRSTSPSWSMMDQSTSNSRFPRSAPADTADPRGQQQQQHRPLPTPIDRPNTAAAHPLSREIATSPATDSRPRSPIPRIASPVPPALRGRVSPFPTAPVLPREQTTQLMRRTSKLTQEAVIRASRYGTANATAPAPASASGYPATHSRWPSQDRQLGVQWQPRSASALDTRRPSDLGHDSDDGGSFLAYDDEDEDEEEDLSDRSPNTRPTSAEPPEPSPDVNQILAGFRAEQSARLEGHKAHPVRESHTLSTIVAGYERDTVYLDEEGGGDRYSVWSDAASRHSFLDTERSAAIREKFVRRVEAMYGKDTVPPVPHLEAGLRSASS
ncbi:hypothetical protein BC628DRAFT_1341179 [Trametes gibbosa]|nr:hypothetical protein BC628DRAFT_1341179 [Trametes gibbosa]